MLVPWRVDLFLLLQLCRPSSHCHHWACCSPLYPPLGRWHILITGWRNRKIWKRNLVNHQDAWTAKGNHNEWNSNLLYNCLKSLYIFHIFSEDFGRVMLEHIVLIVATKKRVWIDSSWLWLSHLPSSTHISHNHSLQWLKKAVDVARPRKNNMDTKNDGYWNNVSPASNMDVILVYLSRWLSRNEGMKQSAGYYHAWRIIPVDVSG